MTLTSALKQNVLWKPNSDVQRAFLACTARTALMHGGAGSGKTSALLVSAALQCANPKSHAIICRRDMPSLRQMISASYGLFLPMRATYNKAEHVWTFPSGGTLAFGHLEDEVAMYQHAGQEYSFIGFDELTQLPGDATDSRGQPINSMFSFMMSRLRAPKDSDLRLEVRATATPGGVGMQWVKSYFRIGDSGGSGEFVDEVTGFRRAHFRATVRDNPALAGGDYERQLADLPAAKRKALLYGDWSSCEGQIFESWNYDLHTCQPFAIPASWELWRCGDDGFNAPAAIHWLTQNPDDKTIYVVAEIYERGQLPEELARKILSVDYSIMLDYGLNVQPNDQELSGWIDSAAFSDVGTGKASRAATMNQLGCNWRPVVKGSGSVAAGLSAIHSALALRKDGTPGLRIFRCCKHLIRTLPTLVYDTTNPETFDDNCESHAVDSLRYGLTRKIISFRLARVRGL